MCANDTKLKLPPHPVNGWRTEEQRIEKGTEEQRIGKGTEEQRIEKGTEEQRIEKGTEDMTVSISRTRSPNGWLSLSTDGERING